MSEKPRPPVSPDVDLKDFAFTPLFRARLFGSSFHARATDAEWRAGLTLWLKSQDQAPAGSLPNDDVDLCRLAELGRDVKTWSKIKKMALHGWYECDDGRLYNAVVAEVVNQQWQRKCAQRDRTEAARAARAAKRLQQSLSQSDLPSVTDEKKHHAKSATGSKGQGQGQGQLEEEKGELRSPNRIPPKSERAESLPARGEDQEIQDSDPVVRPFGPPPQAPSKSRLGENIKTQLRQKLMRYCNATMQGPASEQAVAGLMGLDGAHDQQWWLDELDRRRKRENWDDTREWKHEHLGAAQ